MARASGTIYLFCFYYYNLIRKQQKQQVTKRTR